VKSARAKHPSPCHTPSGSGIAWPFTWRVQEILTGFRLNRDEPIPVLGLQHGLQLLGIDALATLDDGFRVG
jgi:hypothetical protein